MVPRICHVGEFGLHYGVDWYGGSWSDQEEGIWVASVIGNSALAVATELWVQHFCVADRVEISDFSDVGLSSARSFDGRKDLENGLTFGAIKTVFSRPTKFVREGVVLVNCRRVTTGTLYIVKALVK